MTPRPPAGSTSPAVPRVVPESDGSRQSSQESLRPPPPRWTDSALPPYAFLPGRTPHPYRSREGHSWGRPPPAAETLEPERWREDHAWLLGVDLWNAGYFWEAHELWESAWKARDRKGRQAVFLQAMIKAAAAEVKIRSGAWGAARALWTRAAAALEPFGGDPFSRFMGLDVRAFCIAAEGRFLGPAVDLPVVTSGDVFLRLG